jgi:hypothetical protein
VLAELLQLVVVDEHGRPLRWPVRQKDLPASVRMELEVFTANDS